MVKLHPKKLNKIKHNISKRPEFINIFSLLKDQILAKASSKKRAKIVRKIARKKRRLNFKLKYLHNERKNLNRKPNIKKFSYGNRFLIKNKRKLYKKTVLAIHEKKLQTKEEYELLSHKQKSIKREQRRHFFRQKFSKNAQKYKPLNPYDAKGAKIFITFIKKNVFVTIMAVTGENYDKDITICAKMSCGSIGYRNKKKTTSFAADETIKAGGQFLANNSYTSLDIIFTSNRPYYSRKIISRIINTPTYVRSISYNHNRPQSYVRKRKAPRK